MFSQKNVFAYFMIVGFAASPISASQASSDPESKLKLLPFATSDGASSDYLKLTKFTKESEKIFQFRGKVGKEKVKRKNVVFKEKTEFKLILYKTGGKGSCTIENTNKYRGANFYLDFSFFHEINTNKVLLTSRETSRFYIEAGKNKKIDFSLGGNIYVLKKSSFFRVSIKSENDSLFTTLFKVLYDNKIATFFGFFCIVVIVIIGIFALSKKKAVRKKKANLKTENTVSSLGSKKGKQEKIIKSFKANLEHIPTK